MFCTKCGNKIQPSYNFCIKCGNPVNGTKVFENNNVRITTYVKSVLTEHDENKTEEETANLIVEDLGVDRSLFEYKKPAEDYSTITYKGNDLFRIKYTEKARWIRILMVKPYSDEYIDSEMFSAQTNKNQLFWKSTIKSIFDYKEVLLKAIKEIDDSLEEEK